MPQDKLAAIIGRAAVDQEYLALLKANPQAIVTATPDLTDAEKQAVLGLDHAELDALAGATAGTQIEAIVNKKDG